MKKFTTGVLATLILVTTSCLAFASYAPTADRSVPGADNFRVNTTILLPQLAVGEASGTVDVKLNKRLTLGPTFTYHTNFDGKHTGYHVGANMKIGLNKGVFDDKVWLFNPYVEFVHHNVDASFFPQKTKGANGIEVGANLLYQWMWDNGVNMQAGVGILYTNSRPNNFLLPFLGTRRAIMPTATWTIGYAF